MSNKPKPKKGKRYKTKKEKEKEELERLGDELQFEFDGGAEPNHVNPDDIDAEPPEPPRKVKSEIEAIDAFEKNRQILINQGHSIDPNYTSAEEVNESIKLYPYIVIENPSEWSINDLIHLLKTADNTYIDEDQPLIFDYFDAENNMFDDDNDRQKEPNGFSHFEEINFLNCFNDPNLMLTMLKFIDENGEKFFKRLG